MVEPNAFTGARLDRAGDGRRRRSGWVDAQREDPAARALVLGDAGLRGYDGRLELVRLAELERDAERDSGAEPALLGLDHEGPVWAIDTTEPPPVGERAAMIGASGPRDSAAVDQRHGWLGLREAAAALPQSQGGLAAYAAGLLNWHRTHRFCSVCGAATEQREGGALRSCPRCGSHHHPRTDPVVIMLVTGPGRLLLGRQRSWPARRYSALAGFVEPGESLEEAVAREVGEEAGVEVGRPAYVSSQPWPFPASLMLGFTVPHRGGEPAGADAELEDVRWFEREQVAEAATRDDDWSEGGPDVGLQLPPRTAIARRLIEGWLAGPAPGPERRSESGAISR